MSIVAFVVCIVFVYYGYLRYGKIINPISVYSASWGFSLVMNILLVSLYGGYPVGERTIIILVASVLCFGVGASNKYSIGITRPKQFFIEDNVKIKMLLLLHVVCYAIVLPNTINSLRSLLGGSGMVIIRQSLIVGDGSQEFTLAEMLKQITALPIIYATIYIAFDDLLLEGKRRKKSLLVIVAIADIVFYTVAYLGRMMIQNTIIFVGILLLSKVNFESWDPKRKKRIKRVMIVVGGLAICALIFITRNRSLGSGSNVFYTVVSYFGGPLKYFDTGIDVVRNDNVYLFGTGLFAGLWDIVLIPFQKVFGIDFPRPLEIITAYNTPLRLIGENGLHLTAFGTVLLNMYIDGRLIGVIIDSILLGSISAMMYNNNSFFTARRERIYSNAWMMFLVWSVLYWDGNRMASFLVFFYIAIMTNGHTRIKIRR